MRRKKYAPHDIKNKVGCEIAVKMGFAWTENLKKTAAYMHEYNAHKCTYVRCIRFLYQNLNVRIF